MSGRRTVAPRARSARRIAACGLAVLAATAVLRADVFLRLPKTAENSLRQLGGVCAYATDATINGAPGGLAVYAFPRTSASEVRSGLARSLGQPAADSAFGGTLATHVGNGRAYSLAVLPSASGESACVALLFDQSAADYAHAKGHPAEWPQALPALAAAPLFTASCGRTRTAFVTAETAAEPEAAVADASDRLRSAGWSRQSPPRPATFAVFASGRKICLLFASRSSATGRTTISVLQREGATQ